VIRAESHWRSGELAVNPSLVIPHDPRVLLVGAGVTRLGRGKVATVVAELADGTAPSTIARKVGVGYATVARIAETTKRLH
jgi:hypothetical protein